RPAGLRQEARRLRRPGQLLDQGRPGRAAHAPRREVRRVPAGGLPGLRPQRLASRRRRPGPDQGHGDELMGSPRDLYDTIVVASGGAAITASGDAVEFDRLNGGNPVHDLVAVADVTGITASDSAVITLKPSASTASMSAVESTLVQG